VWEKIKKEVFMWIGGIASAVFAFLFFRGTFGRRVGSSEELISDIRDCDARKERLEERQRDLNSEQRDNNERQREIVERQREAVSKERELREREHRIDEREKGAVEQLGEVIKSVEARRNAKNS
jgi:predicted RNase H-like nuclease (RuvC/YqgF family)